ncbi:MAG: HAD family hydrolase [Anaerolineae bacterium]|jgi:FMN phosphatase YigB (HAD superfamily)|nr:HAD family hydrolase [Anaerolineae bacterium]
MMPIRAILFEGEGVLYHRPRQDRHLSAFLSTHGLTLRHRQVVARALKAARYDVQSGRISRDTFYDAILRVHGLQDVHAFPEGRAAMLRDAADIELFPGVMPTLDALHAAGYLLGIVSDSAHPSREKIAWLALCGLASSLWSAFVVSSEIGHLKTGGAIFEQALQAMGTDWPETAYVGHDSDELVHAGELGLTTIAFMPDDPAINTTYRITSFYGLHDLFLGKQRGQ